MSWLPCLAPGRARETHRLAQLAEFVCNPGWPRAPDGPARRQPLHNTGNPMAAYEFTVTVKTQYLEEQSDPSRSHYVFAYAITIVNTGTVPAQLISRHWVITDANNHVKEVRGLGVVGHQPFLQPGEQFEYTSGTSLKTPQGSMHGEYFCVAEDGEQFDVRIPEFVLSLPRTLH
jgi:ApaG protein